MAQYEHSNGIMHSHRPSVQYEHSHQCGRTTTAARAQSAASAALQNLVAAKLVVSFIFWQAFICSALNTRLWLMIIQCPSARYNVSFVWYLSAMVSTYSTNEINFHNSMTVAYPSRKSPLDTSALIVSSAWHHIVSTSVGQIRFNGKHNIEHFL